MALFHALLPADWKDLRADAPSPFHAIGDFNGDGLQDSVWLLPSTSGRGFGVFAYPGSRTGIPEAIRLTSSRNDPPQRYGLLLVKSGSCETACGKGYGDCKKGEPEQLNLKTDAIEFYLVESSSSIFWWDARVRKFQRTWTSD